MAVFTKLKMYMLACDIKQSDIAKAAGVHPAYINRIVNGKQKCTEAIAEAFKQSGIDVAKYL